MIRNSQHSFTKVKSCLTNVITFYNELIDVVDKRRKVGIVNLDFSKAFDTLSSLLS